MQQVPQVHPTKIWPLIDRGELNGWAFRQARITGVALVGINTTNEYINAKLVHWRLSFTFHGPTGQPYPVSVTAEIEKYDPNTNNRTTSVGIVTRPFIETPSLHKLPSVVFFPFLKAMTIDQVITVMERCGHHRFENSTSRSGCYYWCYTVITALMNTGQITGLALDDLARFIDDMIVNYNYNIPYDFVGRFYAPGPHDEHY